MATEHVKLYEVDEAHHEEAHEHHGGSLRLYWAIAGVLLLATVVEVRLTDYLAPGSFTRIGTMLSIAFFKAALVVLFYMHLKYEKRVLWLIFAIPFFLVSLLALTLFAQP